MNEPQSSGDNSLAAVSVTANWVSLLSRGLSQLQQKRIENAIKYANTKVFPGFIFSGETHYVPPPKSDTFFVSFLK